MTKIKNNLIYYTFVLLLELLILDCFLFFSKLKKKKRKNEGDH